MHSLTKNVKTLVVEAAGAAGITDLESDWVDTLGFQGVRFIAHVGTLTATQVTKMRLEYSSDGSTDAGDVEGSEVGPLGDGDGNKLLISEVYRPKYRYVRAVLDRGTANAVLNGIVAELYGAGDKPVTKDTSVFEQAVLNGAPVGTA